NSLNNKNVNLEITSPAPVSNSLLVVSPPKVQEGKNVNINGYNFSINSTVEILIKDENGTTVFGINITTDLNGDFNYAFNSSTLGTGNYTIFANDLANPLNDKSVSLEIIKKAAPGKGGPGGTGCARDWECEPWSKCDFSGIKYRKCVDLKKCNALWEIEESEKCTAAELCDNGLWDSGEQGIDCGGACPACSKGQLVDQGGLQEEGVKAGEEGVGVAGEEEEAPVQLPFGVGVQRCPVLGWPWWLLYLLVVMLTGINSYRHRCFKIISKWKDEIERIRNIYGVLVVANALLVIIILLDLYCWFRWYIFLLLIPPVALLVIMINELKRKQCKPIILQQQRPAKTVKNKPVKKKAKRKAKRK
ncbi:hypothetical protein KY311_00375, partial [Candidatus Woesearchaeota archaeon]|nr:hypothetical protein [Candidatus Woesearchaeota archaeon]